jgi:hypothetical protein
VNGIPRITEVVESNLDTVRSGQVRGKDFVQTSWSERNAERGDLHVHFSDRGGDNVTTTAPC